MKFLRTRLGKLLFCALLQWGALFAPVRPDEIEKLLSLMNQTKMAQVMTADDDDQGTDPTRWVIPPE